MKKVLYILIAVLAVTFTTSCEDKVFPEVESPSVDLVPELGYIFFDSDVTTRGQLINGGNLQKDFGVVGYKFSGTNWTGYKAKAKPNVFTNGTPGTYVNSQQVIWEGSSHNYSPLVPWTEHTYAFFAFYPHNLSVSGKDYEGSPYVDYTIDRNDPTKLVDVMTACDKTATASQMSVSFQMEHRLSALSVYARSSVNKAVFETLKNDTSIGEVYVLIKDFDLELQNLEYDTVRIPLDSDEQIRPSQTGSTTVNYNNLTSSTTLNYFSTNSDQVDLTAGEKTLILIPQDGILKCKISVTYDIVNAQGTSVWDKAYPSMTSAEKNEMQNQIQTVEVDGLDVKVRKYLILNLTKTGLSVDATKAAQWDDVPVDYEFE